MVLCGISTKQKNVGKPVLAAPVPSSAAANAMAAAVEQKQKTNLITIKANKGMRILQVVPPYFRNGG